MKISPDPLVLGVLILAASAPAATLVVAPDGSGDHPTIQAAVDAAADGDGIMLLNGTFGGPGNRDVTLHGRSLSIYSKAGDPEVVTVACDGKPGEPHRFLQVIGGGDVAVEGITVIGGYAGGRIPGGGGMLITSGASVGVVDCVFEDNHTAMSWDHAGGAVYVDESCHAAFTCCEFRQNSGYFGGAVGVNHYSNASFEGCRFEDNVAGRGGAIWGNSTTKIGCVLVGNTAEQGGAIWGNGYNDEVSWGCTYALNGASTGGAIYAQTGYGWPVVLENTVIAHSSQGAAVHADSSVPLQITCTDLYENMDGDWVGPLAPFENLDGNFSADPCFCDLDAHELTVCGDSFCLPAYSPGGCEARVGALGAGCPDCGCAGGVATESRSWSAVRGIFGR
jgi:hypothetical protein